MNAVCDFTLCCTEPGVASNSVEGILLDLGFVLHPRRGWQISIVGTDTSQLIFAIKEKLEVVQSLGIQVRDTRIDVLIDRSDLDGVACKTIYIDTSMMGDMCKLDCELAISLVGNA